MVPPVAVGIVLVAAVTLVDVVPSAARTVTTSSHRSHRVVASTLGSPLFGVTIDSVDTIAAVIEAERLLPQRPTTRVYFDVKEPASYYASAVSQLHTVSGVMGELLDSSDVRRISVAGYQRRVDSYLSTLGSSVDVWEIDNEVNGNWTKPYRAGAAKIDEAYGDVSARGAPSALTLYANEYGPDHCGDGMSELTPVEFSERYLTSAVRRGLTYVFESYYPTQCGDVEPTDAEVASEMEQLHQLYPNALLGFGEVGLPKPVRATTLATGEQVMAWAYGLDPGLAYYVGGYFWWYALEDAFTSPALLSSSLADAFDSERAALAP